MLNCNRRNPFLSLERYNQVGAIRDACKGRKAWIPPEAPKGLRAARLGIPADLTLGSIGRRSLQDIAGMEVSNVFGLFSTNLQRKVHLTNAFKTFFRDASFQL